jgi:hypothetical protein
MLLENQIIISFVGQICQPDPIHQAKPIHPVLHEHLMLFQGCTQNGLVSASIEQEDACRARMEERKKKPLSGPTGGAPPMYRLVYTPPSGQPRDHPPSQ